VRVIALGDRFRAGVAVNDRSFDRLVCAVEDLDAVTAHDHPVTLFQIGDTAGPRSKRDGVRSQIVFARAVADRQRRSHARADHQAVMVAEQEGHGKGAVKPRQDGGDRFLRGSPCLDLAGD
jgi:hypothetical protein